MQKKTKQLKPTVRQPSKRVADARRVRYGSGWAPRVVRPLDDATQDSRAVRFGSGWMHASLRK